MNPAPTPRIEITYCPKSARASHANLKPKSIHYIVRPPKGEPRNFQNGGVWVMGALNEPVFILFGEFMIYWEDGYYSRVRRTRFRKRTRTKFNK